jgi:hypothetical protein
MEENHIRRTKDDCKIYPKHGPWGSALIGRTRTKDYGMHPEASPDSHVRAPPARLCLRTRKSSTRRAGLLVSNVKGLTDAYDLQSVAYWIARRTVSEEKLGLSEVALM